MIKYTKNTNKKKNIPWFGNASKIYSFRVLDFFFEYINLQIKCFYYVCRFSCGRRRGRVNGIIILLLLLWKQQIRATKIRFFTRKVYGEKKREKKKDIITLSGLTVSAGATTEPRAIPSRRRDANDAMKTIVVYIPLYYRCIITLSSILFFVYAPVRFPVRFYGGFFSSIFLCFFFVFFYDVYYYRYPRAVPCTLTR